MPGRPPSIMVFNWGRTPSRSTPLSAFSEALDSREFVVTCELNPPKGVELDLLFEKAENLRNVAVAINVTDSASSRMTMGNLAVAHMLSDRGIEPILQMTCRDRNRLALQSEVLAAHVLGIRNVLIMSGDPPQYGDHPETKPVFDLDASALLGAIRDMRGGADMAGNELDGSPDVFPGAVVNPGASDLDGEIGRMESKLEAGARFFQTQAVYEAASFEQFARRVEGFGVPLLAGMIVLKSPKMAAFLNEKVPGITVPDALIQRIEDAADRRAAGVEITAGLIRDVREMCQGVHIMAIGWEAEIPRIVQSAGLGVAA